MTQPTKPQPPAKPPVTPKKPAFKKHLTKPLTGGTTYVAVSFSVSLPVDTENTPGDLKVRFYDSAGNLIPNGIIKPIVQIPPIALRTAIQTILAVPAVAGELMPQWLLRAATPHVQALYGAQV
jgi:hypothetical protein